MWDVTRSRWDEQSLLLLEAFEMYDTSLCGGCAQSSIHALNVANTREYTVDTVNCIGCNVRETWSEQNAETRIKGEKVYVINAMGKVVE